MRRSSILFCLNIDPNMDRDTKYDALYDQLNELIETFGRVLEMYMANLNVNDDYLEQPMPLPE